VPNASSLRRDIVSAYLVTFARVFAWIVVTATVVRTAGKDAFGLLAIVQSTVGILEYAAIGLSPAIIRLTAEALQKSRNHNASENTPEENEAVYDPQAHRLPAVQTVYANGFAMAVLAAIGGGVLLTVFLLFFRLSETNKETKGVALELVCMVGVSTLLRMMSDAPGAALQTSGQIFVDNILLTMHEIVWGVGTAIDIRVLHLPWQRATGFALLLGSILLLSLRGICSHHFGSGLFEKWWLKLNPRMVRRLLIFGGMVVAAQMADYLYAPTNNILILNLIGRPTVAVYAPAVQVDGCALLLVGALASVLLPRSALAHAAGDPQTVRAYYVRGTLATFFGLLFAAPFVVWGAPYFFKLWLGNRMEATCAILPMILIHTIMGGSSAVGRSILLAIGKVRPFTISVLVGGVANVILSFVFVRYGHLGLRGIVLGTILAVAGRCVLWLPWYILRALRQSTTVTEPSVMDRLPTPPMP
jgi:O-antigen/teichoic acid export membrane protein